MSRRVLTGVVVLTAALVVPVAGKRPSFVPDWTFSGSALTGWHVLGQAKWTATNGELVGTPTAPEGGWLVLDKSFQDIQVGADVRCAAGCKTGVLVRAEKTATGMKGIYVSLVDGDVGGYAVTLDATGKELTREKLRAGGGMIRFAPSAAEAAHDSRIETGMPTGGPVSSCRTSSRAPGISALNAACISDTRCRVSCLSKTSTSTWA